jgi:hypothetical protein
MAAKDRIDRKDEQHKFLSLRSLRSIAARIQTKNPTQRRKDAKPQSISVFSLSAFSFCLLRPAAVRCHFRRFHSHYRIISFYAEDVNGKMGILARPSLLATCKTCSRHSEKERRPERPAASK